MLPMNCCQYSLEQSTTEKEMNTIKEGFYHLPTTLWRNLQIWISFSIHKYGLRVVGSIVEEIVLFGFITLFTSILFLDYIHHFVHRHILGSVGSTVLLGPFPILQWPWTFSPPHENRWKLLPWLTHIEKDLHFNVYCKGAPSISEMDWVVRYPQETDNPVSFLNARGTEHTEGYNSTPLTYWRSKPSSNERTR